MTADAHRNKVCAGTPHQSSIRFDSDDYHYRKQAPGPSVIPRRTSRGNPSTFPLRRRASQWRALAVRTTASPSMRDEKLCPSTLQDLDYRGVDSLPISIPDRDYPGTTPGIRALPGTAYLRRDSGEPRASTASRPDTSTGWI